MLTRYIKAKYFKQQQQLQQQHTSQQVTRENKCTTKSTGDSTLASFNCLIGNANKQIEIKRNKEK
jgi:predicted transcriptional regulator